MKSDHELQELIDYIAGFSLESVPSSVLERAKLLLLDNLGSVILGAGSTTDKAIARISKSLSGSSESTIVGARVKCASNMAAFANACYAQIYDFNDGHRVAAAIGGSTHPGRVVIPAALAEAEHNSSTGKELLAAIIIGYDVACKVIAPKRVGGVKIQPSSYYASAAVAGRLRRFSPKLISSALGIAGYTAPSKFANSASNSGMNYYSNGYRARFGIEAAIAAENGQPGAILKDDPARTKRFIRAGLGSDFEVMNVYIKPWPSCRMTHSAIAAVLSLKAQNQFDSEDIIEILIEQLPNGMYTARKKPTQPLGKKGAQFNIFYCVARAVLDGDLGVKQFEPDKLTDPAVYDLIKKIHVKKSKALGREYPEKNRPSVVSIRIKNGKSFRQRIDLAPGDPANPLDRQQIYEKFLKNAEPLYGKPRAGEILELVMNIEREETVFGLTNLLALVR